MFAKFKTILLVIAISISVFSCSQIQKLFQNEDVQNILKILLEYYYEDTASFLPDVDAENNAEEFPMGVRWIFSKSNSISGIYAGLKKLDWSLETVNELIEKDYALSSVVSTNISEAYQVTENINGSIVVLDGKMKLPFSDEIVDMDYQHVYQYDAKIAFKKTENFENVICYSERISTDNELLNEAYYEKIYSYGRKNKNTGEIDVEFVYDERTLINRDIIRAARFEIHIASNGDFTIRGIMNGKEINKAKYRAITSAGNAKTYFGYLYGTDDAPGYEAAVYDKDFNLISNNIDSLNFLPSWDASEMPYDFSSW